MMKTTNPANYPQTQNKTKQKQTISQGNIKEQRTKGDNLMSENFIEKEKKHYLLFKKPIQ